jgi:hypothetical protein
MKAKSKYHAMSAGELARITRERGLDKPEVITRSEWADFLAADDAKPVKVSRAVDTDADRDSEDAPPDNQRPTDKKKGK